MSRTGGGTGPWTIQTCHCGGAAFIRETEDDPEPRCAREPAIICQARPVQVVPDDTEQLEEAVSALALARAVFEKVKIGNDDTDAMAMDAVIQARQSLSSLLSDRSNNEGGTDG